MTEQFANFATTTLNGGIDNAVTTVVVTSATPFPSSAQYRITIDSEIMIVTAGAGTTSWTVTRGAESTSAASHSNGAAVSHTLTSGSLATFASLTSPTFAGTPSLPTGTTAVKQSAGNNSTAPATTSYVDSLSANAASGVAKIVRRTGDATAINSGNTGTTLTSDDTLLWAMAANEIWLFNLYVIATTANLAMDLKIGMTGPASATADWGATGNAASAIAGWGAAAVGGTPAALTISGSVGVGGANNARFIVGFAGIVVNSSTPGNLNIQFAQNTSDAGNLVIKTNSSLVLWRIA